MKEKRDEFEVGKQQAMTDTYQEQVEKLGEARRKAAELLNEDLNEVMECFLVVLCVWCVFFFFLFFWLSQLIFTSLQAARGVGYLSEAIREKVAAKSETVKGAFESVGHKIGEVIHGIGSMACISCLLVFVSYRTQRTVSSFPHALGWRENREGSGGRHGTRGQDSGEGAQGRGRRHPRRTRAAARRGSQ